MTWDQKDTVKQRKIIEINRVDNLLRKIHVTLKTSNKLIALVAALAVYLIAFLRFGEILTISCNYFVIAPLIAASFCWGLTGGIITGILGLPANLLLFAIIGHPEYSPANKIIAEIFGIIVGTVTGYMSDYYYNLEAEVGRRQRAEQRLLETIEEKELLLQEIHHRVKNNLNIVKSLIQLQLNRSDNESFIIQGEKLIQRIYSISLVHEQLCNENECSEIYLMEYVPALVDNVLKGLDEGSLKVAYRMDAPGSIIRTEQASPLGLILNEVLTNALKFGFPRTESPELTVVLAEQSGNTVIELIDNTPTFLPSDADFDGLGLKLIKTLAVQLGARWEFLPGEGTTFRITFPSD